jgi:hypothetical protein
MEEMDVAFIKDIELHLLRINLKSWKRCFRKLTIQVCNVSQWPLLYDIIQKG